MKYRLSTLLLIMALLAVSLGWYLERRHYESRLDEEVAREGKLRTALAGAGHSNSIYDQLEKETYQRFSRNRRVQLLSNVLSLYQHEHSAVVRTISKYGNHTTRVDQKGNILGEACRSLLLLEVKNKNDFVRLMQMSRVTERWLVDDYFEGEVLSSELVDFVHRCFEMRPMDTHRSLRQDSLWHKLLNENELRQIAGEGYFREGRRTVIAPGRTTAWDAGALGSMSVVKVGETYHMYYEAWGVRSDKGWDADEYSSLQIGHATSGDGIQWFKDPANPVIPRGPEGSWDRTGTWDPFVLHEDGKFKMWFGGGGAGKPCGWAYAESMDGTNFTGRRRLSNLGHVEDVHVVRDPVSGNYWMYYWDRQHEPHGLFRAESPNETDFDFANAEPIRIEGEDVGKMFKFTHVVPSDDGWLMLYSDFERPHCPNSWVRLATSPDGIKWTSVNKRLVAGHDGELLRVADDLALLYYGPRNHFDAKDCDIRVAILHGELETLAQDDRANQAERN